ncbi:hypothetical protein A3F66_04810 [candidate division TM6 bacterium RIFCSPHIGHO2_12_FULL_32_22]|nr:MAG: hypothetical protein A3F66_04810 [candidate division TM6 bacterium RIFCSPHIGHO2_12_FULL_32_22]
MQIQPNFTIVIQIFNFLISFLILRRFFLKPAIDVLLEKEADKKKLEDKKSNLEVIIEEKNNSILNLWKEAKSKFYKYIKDCASKIYFRKLKIKSIVENSVDNKALVSELNNLLVKKLENVG